MWADLDDDAQVAALRPIALDGATQLGLTVTDIELALHAYNTTFKVSTTDGDYAVRVLTNSGSSPDQVTSQHDWMTALADQVTVPRPVTGPDGHSYALVPDQTFDTTRTVVAASWLPGDDIGTVTTVHARTLGHTMALMHEQAATWQPPRPLALPHRDHPLFGDQDAITAAAAALPAPDRQVFETTFAVAFDAYAAIADQPQILVHADLHGGNLKWHNDTLAVFDFDDCGIASAALDLAIALFYVRGADEQAPAAEADLRAGYQQVRAWPDIDDELLESLIATRQLLLINTLLYSTTGSQRAQAEQFLDVSVQRLRHWQRTGRFTRAIS